MIIEAGVASSPDIVLFAVRGQCHPGEMLPAFCFTNHLAPAAIRQSHVTHNGVEVLRSHECKRAFHIVRCGNGMTEMPKQAGQDAAGIAVILDHQYLQGHNSGKTSHGHERLAQLPQSKWPRHLVASSREKIFEAFPNWILETKA